MSIDKKYFYLKLKDNYFEQDNIKVLESMENGHIYSLIIIKLYLKSLKSEGCLMMTSNIPYSPDKINILANVINHDVDHVKSAIRIGLELEIITILDTKQMWMTDIQNFIGHSSTEADRIRDYRKKLTCTNVQQTYDKSTPEIELDIDIDIDKKKERDIKKYGELENIPLSPTDYNNLITDYGEEIITNYINKVSYYISSKGKRYKNYNATIRGWLNKDNINKLNDGGYKYERVDHF